MFALVEETRRPINALSRRTLESKRLAQLRRTSLCDTLLPSGCPSCTLAMASGSAKPRGFFLVFITNKYTMACLIRQPSG